MWIYFPLRSILTDRVACTATIKASHRQTAFGVSGVCGVCGNHRFICAVHSAHIVLTWHEACSGTRCKYMRKADCIWILYVIGHIKPTHMHRLSLSLFLFPFNRIYRRHWYSCRARFRYLMMHREDYPFNSGSTDVHTRCDRWYTHGDRTRGKMCVDAHDFGFVMSSCRCALVRRCVCLPLFDSLGRTAQ